MMMSFDVSKEEYNTVFTNIFLLGFQFLMTLVQHLRLQGLNLDIFKSFDDQAIQITKNIARIIGNVPWSN